MADYMQTYADKELKKLGKKIGRTYWQAAAEINSKLKSFWESHKVISERMLKDVKDGKITEQDYKNWLQNQVFRGDRWQSKLDEITKVYMNADEEARKMVGDKDKDMFAHAANWQAKDTSRAVNGAVSFDMYDRKTVDRLIRDNPKMLPEWKINKKKDYIWNEKRVQNAVTQGILQGESVYDIGKRLTTELAAKNASKMDMFARTAVTGAQNAGRIERLHEAQEMGIKVKKKWLTAHDARVRDAHIALDGDEKDIDEPFHNEYGDIMYPGDPMADPANTYNCRCTLIYVYPKREEKQEEETEIKEREYTVETFNEEAKRQHLNLNAYDIEDYVSSSYGQHNLGDRISKFIDDAPDEMKIGDTTVYRGMSFDSKDDFDRFIRQHQKGGLIVTRRDGLSWTTDKAVADDFSINASDYSVILINDDNMKNAISISKIADTPSSSSEVLYSSSTDFDVVEIDKKGNTAIIYVTESMRSKRKYK